MAQTTNPWRIRGKWKWKLMGIAHGETWDFETENRFTIDASMEANGFIPSEFRLRGHDLYLVLWVDTITRSLLLYPVPKPSSLVCLRDSVKSNRLGIKQLRHSTYKRPTPR